MKHFAHLLLGSLTLSLLASCSLFRSEQPQYLIYDTSTSLYGFIDSLGQVVVAPQFDESGVFSYLKERRQEPRFRDLYPDGLAVKGITIDSIPMYGYVDEADTFVIQPVFHGALAFSEGLAQVCVEERGRQRRFMIDTRGNRVFEKKYDSMPYYHDGLAVMAVEVEPDTLAAVDELCETESLKGYLDKQGNVAIRPTFFYAEDFSEGLACVAVKRDDVILFGYINTLGNFVIEPQFIDAISFHNGMARVEMLDQEGARCYAYVNRRGEVVWKMPVNDNVSLLFLARHPLE